MRDLTFLDEGCTNYTEGDDKELNYWKMQNLGMCGGGGGGGERGGGEGGREEGRGEEEGGKEGRRFLKFRYFSIHPRQTITTNSSFTARDVRLPKRGHHLLHAPLPDIRGGHGIFVGPETQEIARLSRTGVTVAEERQEGEGGRRKERVTPLKHIVIYICSKG
jgi:hypothetical protein